MTTAPAERPATTNGTDPALLDVLIRGDLKSLTPAQKVDYCNQVCQSLGLTPLTQPFAYIMLNGKEVLYAKRDAAEQLRKVHNVSVTITAREVMEGVYIVTARATLPTGRTDESTGAVPIENVKGEARANALMKAETKAKRRVTLSICGLGMLDETEVESIPNVAPSYTVDAPQRLQVLPAGTVQILHVKPMAAHGAQWAEVTFVTETSEEYMLPTPADGTGAAASLLEQLADEAVPVVLTTKITPRSKKKVIDEVHRWTGGATMTVPAAPVESAAAITAADIPF